MHRFGHVASIATAECASTLVSLGSVLVVSANPALIKPAQDFVTKHFIYPMMAHQPLPVDIDPDDPLLNKASERAGTLVKGGVMFGAGFASHIPIQLALEGKCSAESIRHAMLGKTAGISVALGSVMLLNHLAPTAMPTLHAKICPLFSPNGCENNHPVVAETCRLMSVEIPSSIIAGLINYGITRRMV